MKLPTVALAALFAAAAGAGAGATADKASLVIEGESSAGKVTGEAFLVRTNGAWGVDEELVDLKFD